MKPLIVCGVLVACAGGASAQEHAATVTREPATRQQTVTYEAGGKTATVVKTPASKQAAAPHGATNEQPAHGGASRPADDSPVHGIVRKAPARDASPMKVAPAASTESVAAVIAAAVRAAEQKEKRPTREEKAKGDTPIPPRPFVRAAAPHQSATTPRRYVVRWPAMRVELRWAEPETRLTLSWIETGDTVP